MSMNSILENDAEYIMQLAALSSSLNVSLCLITVVITLVVDNK